MLNHYYKLRAPFTNVRISQSRRGVHLALEVDGVAAGSLHLPSKAIEPLIESLKGERCGILYDDHIEWSDSMRFYVKPIVIDDDNNICEIANLMEQP